MITYIILVMWSIFLGIIFCERDFCLKEKKKIYLFMVMSPICLMTAFRGEHVGRDTAMYIERYYTLSSFDWGSFFDIFSYDSRTEWGYALTAKITSVFSPDSHLLFFFIISTITYFCIAIFFYRTSSNIWMTTVIYFASLMFFDPMNTMRQEVAAAISMSFFPYLLHSNWKKYLYAVGVFIGSLFHTSALIFLFPYLIYKPRNLNRHLIRSLSIQMLFIGIGVFLVYYFFFDFLALFSVYAKDYSNSMFTNGSIENAASMNVMLIRNFFLYGIPILGLMYGLHRGKYTEKEKKIAYYGCFFLFLTMLFNCVGYSITILFRFAMMFNYFTSVAIPLFLAAFGRKLFVTKYLYICLWIIYCIIRLKMQYNGQFIVDYTFFGV